MKVNNSVLQNVLHFSLKRRLCKASAYRTQSNFKQREVAKGKFK